MYCTATHSRETTPSEWQRNTLRRHAMACTARCTANSTERKFTAQIRRIASSNDCKNTKTHRCAMHRYMKGLQEHAARCPTDTLMPQCDSAHFACLPVHAHRSSTLPLDGHNIGRHRRSADCCCRPSRCYGACTPCHTPHPRGPHSCHKLHPCHAGLAAHDCTATGLASCQR